MKGSGGTAEAIKRAAIERFYDHGYEGTSLREIASDVGITVGSLYNHIDAKEDVLFDIMVGFHEQLWESVNVALDGKVGPLDRLSALIRHHVMFGVNYPREVSLLSSELRSLSEPRRSTVIELRSRYEQLFLDEVQAGVNDGVFVAADVRLVVIAILSMGVRVAAWYNPDGRRSIDEIADLFLDFSLRGLSAVPQSTR